MPSSKLCSHCGAYKYAPHYTFCIHYEPSVEAPARDFTAEITYWQRVSISPPSWLPVHREPGTRRF
jgi:hypothetical protein